MTTETATTTPHLTDIRAIMLEQMKALRNATPEDVEVELKRSKGVNELSQTMINSAKVEIDYLRVTKQSQSQFLHTADNTPALAAPQPQNPPAIANGDAVKVTRTSWVDVAAKRK